jgi:hypothetical protein
MKLVQSILATTALADHYRGGTYKVLQRADGKLTLENTQTWFRGLWTGSDLYDSSGCRTTAQSNYGIWAQTCVSSNCNYTQLFYTALFVGSDYCYGDGSNVIDKPSAPFQVKWRSCCWADVTHDDGTLVPWNQDTSKTQMQVNMWVNDVNNNTPSFKLPPLWLIMAGCPNQQIDLAPFDADGDNVRCRWATFAEAGGAYNIPGNWPSLSLDEANCIVKYDGTLDSSTSGVKPVGLMMEDFDANGNVRSSVPVQFLAQVWTPNMSTRSIGAANYPQWFSSDAHKHKEHDNLPQRPSRGRRSLPAYCSAVPTFVAPTPADGHNIDGTSGSVSFTLKAQSGNGSITSFAYQGPSGLTCTTVNSKGEITCNWTMTAAQLKIPSHSFCYDATDNLGLVTDRQCLTIGVVGGPPASSSSSSSSSTITNIRDMATAVLDGSGANGFTAADGKNYGCAGRGMYDAFATTVGAQVDANDKAFYTWKKCVQCASSKPVPAYDYDKDADSCAKSSANSRGVCECDRALVNYLYDQSADNSNYAANQCVSGGVANVACCQWNNYMFAQYNVDHQSCCKDGVKEAGSC